MARYLTEKNMEWELYGPNDTVQPEPTQHALEKSQGLDYRYTGPQEFNRYGDGQMSGGNVISAETAEALERRAEAMLARAAEIRTKCERFGVDDFPEGAVIVFDKRFNEYAGRPIPWSKPYHYAAMKGGGLWNTTGPKSPKGYTWAELIRWMGDGVEEIYYVTKLERFV